MKAKSGKERDKEQEKGKDREKDKLSQREMTRMRRLDAAALSRKEVESLLNQDITGMEEGMDFLESALLTVPGVPYTAEVLVGALFQMSMLPGIKGSKTNTNAVRVVAYVLVGLDMDYKVQAISGAVTDQLAGQIGEIRDKAEAMMGEMQDKLQEVANHMKGKVDEVTANLTENVEKAVQGVRDNVATLTETTASYQDALTKVAPPTHTTLMQQGWVVMSRSWLPGHRPEKEPRHGKY